MGEDRPLPRDLLTALSDWDYFGQFRAGVIGASAMSLMGQSLPIHPAPMPTIVCSKSDNDQNGASRRMTRSANSGIGGWLKSQVDYHREQTHVAASKFEFVLNRREARLSAGLVLVAARCASDTYPAK
jgi:hypothetical protein